LRIACFAADKDLNITPSTEILFAKATLDIKQLTTNNSNKTRAKLTS